MVPQRQRRHAQALCVGVEIVGADAAVEHVGLLVDGEDLMFVEFLEDVAEAQHDDLVANDQHAPVAIMQVDRVEHRAKAQDHVRPALAARRPVIEFTQQPPVRGFLRELGADAGGGQPVENPELALAQPLVDDRVRRAAGERAGAADDLRGLLRPHVRRREDQLGAFLARQCGEPAASGVGLLAPEIGQGHVDVAARDVDLVRAGFVRRVARYVALTLPMPDEPQALRPVLSCRHIETTESTSGEIVPRGRSRPCRSS